MIAAGAKTFKKIALLAALIVPAMMLLGCTQGWVVKVNGKEIDEEIFERRLAEMQVRFGEQTPSPEDEVGYASFRGTVAEDLATRELLKAEAKRMGIFISEEELDEGIQEVVKNRFGGDQQKFEESIASEGITLERAREQLAEGMLLTSLKLEITGQVEPPTDDEIKIAYEKNPKKYEIAPQINLQHIQVASQEEAAAVLARLRAGENMTELARSLSQDQSSRESGGNLGWVLKGSIEDEDLSNAVFALAPGEYSEPIESGFGWHVALVLEARPPVQRSLEESRESVKAELLEKKRDNYWSQWLDSVKQTASIEYRDGYEPPEDPQW